jgi:hypothetical protein
MADRISLGNFCIKHSVMRMRAEMKADLRERLLSVIADYQTETQVIVLVTFDDIFQSKTLSYQWFNVDIPSTFGFRAKSITTLSLCA